MSKRLTLEEVREDIERHGHRLLSTEYKNNYTKLELECPKGHEFKMTRNDFHQGCRCPLCARNRKKTIEEVREYIESKGYKLLSTEYKNVGTKLELECPKGHEFKMCYDSFRYGQRCPKCKGEKQKERMLNGGAAYMLSFVKNPSNPQVELFHLVQEIYLGTVLNYPCLNYSIDIVVPQLNLAIEYDSSYWHQDEDKDLKRQLELEKEGWIFLRYRDYVPILEKFLEDLNQLKSGPERI